MVQSYTKSQLENVFNYLSKTCKNCNSPNEPLHLHVVTEKFKQICQNIKTFASCTLFSNKFLIMPVCTVHLLHTYEKFLK